MKTLVRILVIAGLPLWFAACSSAEMGQLVERGALLAGEDAEKAKQMGTAARSTAEAILPVPQEQELAIGGGVAVKAFETFGPYYEDPAMVRYVNLVGKAVAAKSSRPDLPFAFAVIDNPTPNAFAGPGGYIFITTGALANMHSEAQLAGVLAHEVSHVCQKHALKTLQRAKLVEGASQWAAVADEKNAEQYGQLIEAVEEALFTKGLDQKMEYEADLGGLEIAAATGYTPWGLREYLSQLEALLPTGVEGGWFQTHPPLRERLKRMDVELNKSYAEYRTLPAVRSRFEQNVLQRLKAAKKV